MGDWALHVEGTGAHHNKDNPGDANEILKDTVAKLKSGGHTIHHASFTAGSRSEHHEDVKN